MTDGSEQRGSHLIGGGERRDLFGGLRQGAVLEGGVDLRRDDGEQPAVVEGDRVPSGYEPSISDVGRR